MIVMMMAITPSLNASSRDLPIRQIRSLKDEVYLARTRPTDTHLDSRIARRPRHLVLRQRLASLAGEVEAHLGMMSNPSGRATDTDPLAALRDRLHEIQQS